MNEYEWLLWSACQLDALCLTVIDDEKRNGCKLLRSCATNDANIISRYRCKKKFFLVEISAEKQFGFRSLDLNCYSLFQSTKLPVFKLFDFSLKKNFNLFEFRRLSVFF